MSDEALNAHLDWMDKCAEEQEEAMKLSEHKVYVDAWRHEAVMLFDKPDDTRHYAEMLMEAHDVVAQLEEENEGFAILMERLANWIEKINNSPLDAITDGYPSPDKMVAYLRQRAWEKGNLLTLLTKENDR